MSVWRPLQRQQAVLDKTWPTAQQTQNICIAFIQRRSSVFDVGPTLYKCYTNILCLLGQDERRICDLQWTYMSQPTQYSLPIQCCFNFGSLTVILSQHKNSIGPVYRANWRTGLASSNLLVNINSEEFMFDYTWLLLNYSSTLYWETEESRNTESYRICIFLCMILCRDDAAVISWVNYLYKALN